jgi:AmmeMemoRadiSam system protein B
MGDRRLGLEEHSLEVMVPLLRYFRSDLTILPILVGCGDADLLKAAAVRLAELTREEPDTLLLASTDMSHFVSAATAARLDQLAIERICALDMAGLVSTVARNEISMCGVHSTALLLETVRLLGGTAGEVVCYTHSGETTGDLTSVVAYLSAVLN